MVTAPRMPGRKWLRFSVRSMLVFTAILAFILYLHVHRMNNAGIQKQLVAELSAAGVYTQYDYITHNNVGLTDKWYHQWLERWLGQDYLYNIDGVFVKQQPVTDNLVEKIASLPNLEFVRIEMCTISNESLRPLQKLKRLRFLSLYSTPVSDEGLAIVRSIKTLKTLDLRGTKITDECVPDIISLPNLDQLLIGNTALSQDGITKLKEAFPNGEVDTSRQ